MAAGIAVTGAVGARVGVGKDRRGLPGRVPSSPVGVGIGVNAFVAAGAVWGASVIGGTVGDSGGAVVMPLQAIIVIARVIARSAANI